MRRRALLSLVVLGLAMALVPPAQAATDARVTVDNTAGSYQLANDGGTDETMIRCSEGRRQQNEPTIAVDPSDTDVVVAGSNDYCSAIVNNEVWAGYYRSEDGGTTWANSLVPGYPDDTSEAGEASPVHGKCGASGDPTQAFDGDGNLFYGFICFNRSKPINGGVYVARYSDHGAHYDQTVLVKRGTPSGQFQAGLFQDKINLTTDQTDGDHAGNVYVAWSEYHAFAPTNAVLVSRSTNGGDSFSRPTRVTPQEQGTASFADLAVGPDGTVYLTYLTYPSSARPTADVWLLSSTDGGVSFGDPVNVASVELFDSNQFAGATGTVDCGDGPFACESGFTFSRFFTNSAVAADETGVHVVWASELPSGQNQVFVRNSSDGGETWDDDPFTLDPQEAGHQWFPDVASADGTITVIFYDSRGDPGYDPDIPPGNTAEGVNSGDVVQAFVAQSTDGGVSWIETQVSSAGSNFGWETHGSRRVGFWGDYLYVSSVPGAVNVAWTDSRDLGPGVDPRDGASDNGFSVFQDNCVYDPNDINAPAYITPTIGDPCLDDGGLDQNIYGARL
ncbi:MAG TPA: hypothetical protein VFY08_06975 [Actinomycetota bacterium]|nr:hypothetical protein [Actinomycetota bacterium]